MESIPGKVDKAIIEQFQKLGKYKLLMLIVLMLLASVLSASLWGAAAIGSSRQFRFLVVIAPLLISWMIHVYAGDKKVHFPVMLGWSFLLLSFMLGKYIIFSHYHSFLPNWLKLGELSDFRTALTYLPYVFNRTHLQAFFQDIKQLFTAVDFIWLLAGFYLIWRYRIFSGRKTKKQDQDEKKYIKRRFQ